MGKVYKEVWNKALAVPEVVKVAVLLKCCSRNEGTEEPIGLRIYVDPSLMT